MHRPERCITALLALMAVVLDIWTFGLRCPASPAVNISTLSFGLIVQAIAVGFPLVRGAWFQSASVKHGLKIIALALMLFVGSVIIIRYSVLYSDAIGKPNYFKSMGLACRSSGKASVSEVDLH
jgi:hypothetical protein